MLTSTCFKEEHVTNTLLLFIDWNHRGNLKEHVTFAMQWVKSLNFQSNKEHVTYKEQCNESLKIKQINFQITDVVHLGHRTITNNNE